MQRKRSLISLALSAMVLAATACITHAAAPGTVLDETCYLRHYCQFGVNRYSAAAPGQGDR